MKDEERGLSHQAVFYIKQIPKKESINGIVLFEDAIYFDLEVIDPEFPPDVYDREVLTRRARIKDSLVYSHEWKKFEKDNKDKKVVQAFLKENKGDLWAMNQK